MTAAEALDHGALRPTAPIPRLEAAAEAAGTSNSQAIEAVKVKETPGRQVRHQAAHRSVGVRGVPWGSIPKGPHARLRGEE